MPKQFEFVVYADKAVNGHGGKTYPGASRIRVGEATTQERGDLVLSREEAALLVEQGLGRLVAVGGGLVHGSSVPVGFGG